MTAALIWIKAYVTPHVQYLTFTCQPAQVIGVPKLRFQSKLSYWTVCHLHEPIVGNLVLSLVMCIPLESIDSSCEDDIGILYMLRNRRLPPKGNPGQIVS